MSSKSKYLMRTNVALTSNVKLVVNEKYDLFLESYDSNDVLSDNKYKKVQIGYDTFLSERISKFYENLPIEKAFEVRNVISTDKVQLEYENQYDDIYFSGASEIDFNKYEEEFQYATTLKIEPTKLPKYFFIFRLDGSNVNDTLSINESLETAQLVHTTDLRFNTNLGKFLEKNYITDDNIPVAPFELNLNQFEFSKWHGYNYYTGGTIEKSIYLDDQMSAQDNDFDFEKYITEGFKNSGVICSNYLNLTHLFNDTNTKVFNSGQSYKLSDHAFIYDMINKEQLNKNQFEFTSISSDLYFSPYNHVSYRDRWAINRYSGFYADDLTYITKITPYTSTEINLNDPDIELIDNFFVKFGQNVSPLKNEFNPIVPAYFKIYNEFYLIEKTDDDKYHIVADKLFNGNLLDLYNKSELPISISYSEDDTTPINNRTYRNYIKINNDYYKNDDINMYFNMTDNNNIGIILINLYDEFYRLNRDTLDRYYINTDKIIDCNNSQFTVTMLNETLIESTKVPAKDMDIPFFKIYQINFTDVEDFDFKHLYTDHSNYEYEQTLLSNNENITTLINSMYSPNASITSDELQINRPVFLEYSQEKIVPKTIRVLDNFKYKYNNISIFDSEYILPCSSEYSANNDLYIIDNMNLTDIWALNQKVNKFSFSGSNDVNSLPYKLNNSFEYWGVNNKGFSINQTDISIYDHNLDWFYTFGTPIVNNYTVPLSISDTTSTRKFYYFEYYRTLNIDYPVIDFYTPGQIRLNQIEFDYSVYLQETNIDYLDYFLSQNVSIKHGDDEVSSKPVNRYSVFNETDNSNGSIFMYKGLCGYILYTEFDDYYDLTSTKTNYIADDLSNYKMTAIFTKRETDEVELYGKAGIDFVLNKYHNHLLICIYLYVPKFEITNLEYTKRDHFYAENGIIKYSDNNIYVNSDLNHSDLTLHTIYSIMKNNLMVHPAYSAGINYTILESKTKYTIVNIDTINNIITFDTEHEFTQNSKVEVNGTIFNVELKVDNFNIKLNSILSITINDTVIKATSKKPFDFNMNVYNTVPVNINTNVHTFDNAKLIPRNTYKYLNDNNKFIDVSLNNKILEVFNNENIITYKNRNLFELNIEAKNSINRYSGVYEPMRTSLNLFNTKILRSDNQFRFLSSASVEVQNGQISLTIDATLFNGRYISDMFIDMYKVYVPNNPAFPFLSNVFSSIKSIDAIGTNYIINLTYKLESSVNIVPTVIPYVTLLQSFNNNMLLSFNNYNFGIIQELVISKVDKDLENTRDIRLLYPKLDEHGVTTIDRNIFLSNWNSSFFHKKEKNNYPLI